MKKNLKTLLDVLLGDQVACVQIIELKVSKVNEGSVSDCPLWSLNLTACQRKKDEQESEKRKWFVRFNQPLLCFSIVWYKQQIVTFIRNRLMFAIVFFFLFFYLFNTKYQKQFEMSQKRQSHSLQPCSTDKWSQMQKVSVAHSASLPSLPSLLSLLACNQSTDDEINLISAPFSIDFCLPNPNSHLSFIFLPAFSEQKWKVRLFFEIGNNFEIDTRIEDQPQRLPSFTFSV